MTAAIVETVITGPWKMFVLILAIFIGVYLLFGLVLFYFQESLIFLDEPLDESYEFQFDRPFEEIDLDRPDGGKVNLLHFKPINNIGESKGLIIYFHGNAGNLSRWGFVTEFYTDMGFEVAMPDYRGYGKSRGRRNQNILLEDALAVYSYFKGQVPEEKIIVFGRSLGTGIATFVASKNRPAKLILETPFYSFNQVVNHHLPIFPTGIALRYRFPSHKYLESVTCPVYIFHGTEDSVVPYESGRRLYEKGVQENKEIELMAIQEGEHNNLIDYSSFKAGMRKALEGEPM